MFASPLAIGLLFINSDTSNNAIQTSKEVKESTQTWVEPTVKSFDEYFTDNNITAETITEADLTGTGSSTDPYVVHSTNGFWWLANNSLSGIKLQSKYLEIDCDIVLNEEEFDENGNVSGGDGIVYQWKPLFAGQSTINGKGSEVRGLYYNGEESFVGLFTARAESGGNYYLDEISSLDIKYFYLFSTESNISALISGCWTIDNCNTYNGTVKGKNNVGGIAGSSGSTITNCNNHASVYATGINVGGIVGINSRKIVACSNFGLVTATQYTGGVIGYCSYENGAVNIKDSKNFGQINGGISGTGGIIGYFAVARSQTSNVLGCMNYGVVVATGSQDSVGGIIATLKGSGTAVVNISYCLNYADIDAPKQNVAGIVSSVSASSNAMLTLNIDSCRNEGNLFGMYRVAGIIQYFGSNVECLIKNCINKGSIASEKPSSSVAGVVASMYNNNVTNTICIYNCKNFGRAYDIFEGINTYGSDGGAGGIVGEIRGDATTVISECENSGEIYKGNRAGGIICAINYADGNVFISKCRNYGSVTGGDFCGGIVGSGGGLSIELADCKNYGKLFIVKTSGTIGGIAGLFSGDNVRVLNAENYVSIDIQGNYTCAGIVGNVDECCYVLIKNCVNNGNIKSKNVAGILGTSAETPFVDIVECKVRGLIVGESGMDSGIIAGRLYSNTSNQHLFNIINNDAEINCVNSTGIGLIGYFSGGWASDTKTKELNIKGLKATIDSEAYVYAVYYISGKAKTAQVVIDNVAINFLKTAQTSKNNFSIWRSYYDGMKISGNNLLIKNCYNFTLTKGTNVFVQNVIVDKLTGKDLFYGSDFSAFCIDYKTGKIGLKALSGRNFYRGKVTEEWLLGKGFEKKTA